MRVLGGRGARGVVCGCLHGCVYSLTGLYVKDACVCAAVTAGV